MTVSLKHQFTSPKADGTDSTLVQPSNWNAEHVLTQATGKLLGRTTALTGATEEIGVGANLSFSALTLNLVASPSITGGLTVAGTAGIGGTAVSSAALDIQSTSKGFLAPRMTTAQRDAIAGPATGLMIYNTTLGYYQVYNGTLWTSVGGGATGGGADQIFVENGQTVTTNYTITAGKNAMSAGPISINAGITVTIPTGSVWTIV